MQKVVCSNPYYFLGISHTAMDKSPLNQGYAILGSLTKNRIHRCMYQTTKSMSLLAFVNRLGEQRRNF